MPNATTAWTPKMERSYRVSKEEHQAQIIKKSYIQQRLMQSSEFAKERNDAGMALTRAIEHFVTIEAIQEQTYKSEFNSRGGKAYIIADVGKLSGP